MTEREHLFTILGEECNEIAQRVSKINRFGLFEVEPGQDKDNQERLMEEIDDLFGVITMLKNRRLLGDNSIDNQWRKIEKVEKFLKYSKECGTLND